MSDAHFLLDGASFISTPNVNLLDADTAHSQQSIGSWLVLSRGKNIQQVQVLPPVYGDFHGSWQVDLDSGASTSITWLITHLLV